MALKAPALFSVYSGNGKEKEAGPNGWAKLMRYHGAAPGMFNADDHLAGPDPAQGISLEAAGEAAASLASMQLIQAEGADALEKLVLNVLLSSRQGNMTQPMQQANQLYLDHKPRQFYGDSRWNTALESPSEAQEHSAAAMRGLAAYARNIWTVKKEDALFLWSFVPSRLKWKLQGQPVKITVEGHYPYQDEIEIRVSVKAPAAFALSLRIPAWAEDACVEVNGEGGQAPQPGAFHKLERTWQDGDAIHVSLNAMPRLTRWYHQSGAVEMGPLVLALPLGETDAGTDAGTDTGTDAGTDAGTEKWKAALVNGPMEKGKNGEARVFIKRVRDWPERKNSASAPPIEPKTEGEPFQVALKPYCRCPKRVCQFPVVEK